MILLASSPASADDLKVVATIKPVHALVAEVMAGIGEPTLLVQGTASPHSYALKPSDARALNGASVVFRVSADIEPFTRKIVASLPKTVTVVTLAEAPGLALLDRRTGDTFESHAHTDDDDAAHDHADHDKHDHDEKDDHGHDSRDGHVWLDPVNAVAMVREIARVLKDKDPANAATFDANAATATARIEKTSATIEETLAAARGKPFVVFHDAYQYFERRFAVPAIGAITVSPETQPSAKRLSEIRAKIKELGAVCVFAEPQFKSKLIDTVLEGTNARAGTLDPEGASVEPGPSAYIDLLQNLAANLKSCLVPPA